ncbi:putative secreted protein [Lachnellula suecica]|uniref:Putative secreted protein n=1 Tax=Lachnellula suecica TaxID=602035 RepID=A0A8T9CIF4_9HELO|nr:putative secreted protein [Lachnellula suecica]
MYTLAITLLLPALALAIPLEADFTPLERRQGPAPGTINITSSSTSGNGCPQGTVSTSLSPDMQVVTFGFDSFQTYIGPTAAQADKSKACQIHLDLQYPGGFQYAVVDAVYHGYARLDAGVTGTFLSTYFFSQAASATCTTRSSISGPQWLQGNVYTKEDLVETSATIWSPCGATGLLNVNNRIALSATNSTQAGELSDDDATISFTQQLHVQWKKCTTGSGDTGGGGYTVDPSGSGAKVVPRDPEPQWTIGPGGVVVTPGGNPPHPGDGDTWTVGPGTVTVWPGKE